MSKDSELFTQMRDTLNATREEFNERNESSQDYCIPGRDKDQQVAQFSDSLVYSFSLAPPGHDEERAAYLATHPTEHFDSSFEINSSTAANAVGFASLVNAEWGALGFFLRGGIASGWTYHEGNAIFGEGMIAAYQLESQIAKVPRIVVADEVVDLLPADRSYVRDNLLARDSDGCWFVRPFSEFVRELRKEEFRDATRDELRKEFDELRKKFPDIEEGNFQKFFEGSQRIKDEARTRADERLGKLKKQFIQVHKHIQRELNRAKEKGLDRMAKYRWLAYQFNKAREEIAQHIDVSVNALEVL